MDNEIIKHTPEVEHQTPGQIQHMKPEFYPYLVTDGGDCIARAHTKEWARLIAAAPELLKACKQARAALPDEWFAEPEKIRPVVDLLQAAIAKAEGK